MLARSILYIRAIVAKGASPSVARIVSFRLVSKSRGPGRRSYLPRLVLVLFHSKNSRSVVAAGATDMKLRGIPAELRVGPVDLRDAGPKCAFLQPCLHCKFYNRTYFICKHSHVICVECFLIDGDWNKLNRPQNDGYCKGCNGRVILYRIEIPMPLLRTLNFMCGCGYTGKLADIRKHVKSDEFSEKCSAIADDPPQSSDDLDVEIARFQSEVLETVDDFRSQILCIKEKFTEKFDCDTTTMAAWEILTKDSGDRLVLELGLLNKRIKGIRKDLLKLRKSSISITPLIQDRFAKMFVTLVPNRN